MELCRKCKGKKINTFNIKNITEKDEIEKVNPIFFLKNGIIQ